ncbi:ARM repeat-containing protein [Neocallimastix californiae]|jgi:hypothetical protein|uniref:ARM repeat-containing protein n=1 Tax=Neocallimastix californiae TaxID=1754190 RepID=A0A1Y2C883_9FUNG|nr:ARM repeat-containing protein [Neocallimastix californiae]|eukprot:ORY43243.1 ARM repeat-containing protein [Neocallimastix californiae]
MSSYLYQSTTDSPTSNLETSQSITNSNSASSPPAYLALFNNTNIKSRKKPLLIQSQITKEPLACDIIKQARASLKHPTRPVTPSERRKSPFINKFYPYLPETHKNISHTATNFSVPHKPKKSNSGAIRNINNLNNEIKYISRPYRLKPINPDSLKKLHFPQNNNEFNTNNIFENSYQSLNNLFINDHKLKKNNNTFEHENEHEHEHENNNNLNKRMEELTLNESVVAGHNHKNQDRVLTTSELIISLIRYPLTDLKPEEKNNLIKVINEIIKNHNFSLPTLSKINHWKTKPIHAQFIIDCCGHILSNTTSILIHIGVCKVLFKLSKNDGNDRLFEEYNIIKQLMTIISSINPLENHDNELLMHQYDLLIYSTATLKNVSNSFENQNIIYMMDGTSIFNKIILILIKIHKNTNTKSYPNLNNRPTQILIQITATIRNLVTNEYARSIILKDQIIKSLFLLLNSYSLFNKYEELVLNISRIFSKLSLYSEFQIQLENSTSSIITLAKLLLAHYTNNPLVVRICFILGNLSCERTSCIPDIIFDYIPDLVQLLELLVRKTINKEKKSEESDSQEESNENENENENDKIIKEDQYLKEKEEEDVLIKLIRLIANMALNNKAGPIIAEIPEIKCLVDLFRIRNINDNEELILNIVGAIANISYYNISKNEILDQRLIIAKLLLPLLFHDNVEAIIEASRVFGNITQFQDVCDFAKTSKASEIFVVLLDHSNRDVLYNICGILINLINYQHHCDVYLQNEGVEKLLEILELCINMSDFELASLICKIFYNLCLTDSNWVQKISNSDDKLIQLYNLLEVSQEYQYSIPFINDSTNKTMNNYENRTELKEDNIDLLQNSSITDDFLHYLAISTKLMNKLILYIEYAESQQNYYLINEQDNNDYEDVDDDGEASDDDGQNSLDNETCNTEDDDEVDDDDDQRTIKNEVVYSEEEEEKYDDDEVDDFNQRTTKNDIYVTENDIYITENDENEL